MNTESNGLLADTNSRLAALEAKGAERTIELAAAKDENRRLSGALEDVERQLAAVAEQACGESCAREIVELRKQLADIQEIRAAELAGARKLADKLAVVTKERDEPTVVDMDAEFDRLSDAAIAWLKPPCGHWRVAHGHGWGWLACADAAPTGGSDVARLDVMAYYRVLPLMMQGNRDPDGYYIDIDPPHEMFKTREAAKEHCTNHLARIAAALAQPPAPTGTPLAARDESVPPPGWKLCCEQCGLYEPIERHALYTLTKAWSLHDAEHSAATPSLPPLPAGWTETRMADHWEYCRNGALAMDVADTGALEFWEFNLSAPELLAVLQRHIARQGGAT